jgi:hypothetical protein
MTTIVAQLPASVRMLASEYTSVTLPARLQFAQGLRSVNDVRSFYRVEEVHAKIKRQTALKSLGIQYSPQFRIYL